MSMYPKMLYRLGGDLIDPVTLNDKRTYATRVVASEEDEQAAVALGWHATPNDAAAAADAPQSTDGDDAPPTRAELEQKATELGIEFDGRTSDKKLAKLIAEQLAG